jgi:phenylacetate-CoA ligase
MAETYWERKFWQPDIETMPRKELRELQKKKLFRQLIYAYENAPFYHQLYDKENVDVYRIRSIEDFQKYVPVVDKDMVREYRDRTGEPFGGVCCLPLTASNFAAASFDQTVGRVFRSTGTTGLPTCAIYTERDANVWGNNGIARAFWRVGHRPGTRFLDISTPTFHPALAAYNGIKRVGDIYYKEDHPYWELGLELAKTLDIQRIFFTTFPLRPVAQKMEREGKTLKDYLSHLEGVLQTGEMSRSLGEYYFKVLGVPISNLYGVSEVGLHTTSCLDEGNVGIWQHLPEDIFFFEVLDPGTRKAAEVEFGEPILTNLFFESMAYIRWRSEDWAQIRYAPCLYCGFTHMQIRAMGRVSESVDVKGKLIPMAELEDIIYSYAGSRFLPIQLIREEPQPQDKLRMRICYNAEMVKEPEKYRVEVEDALKKALRVDASVDLIAPEEVKMAGGIKFERVIKEKRQS